MNNPRTYKEAKSFFNNWYGDTRYLEYGECIRSGQCISYKVSKDELEKMIEQAYSKGGKKRG